MSEELHAEFDDVAAWTAEVALDLEPEYRVPAACRGSGSPPVLRWFLDRLALGRDSVLLDVGAGVGGPAAFAAAETDVRPVLSEPEAGACQASRRLFDLPVVQAASRLPFRSQAFDVGLDVSACCAPWRTNQACSQNCIGCSVATGASVCSSTSPGRN